MLIGSKLLPENFVRTIVLGLVCLLVVSVGEKQVWSADKKPPVVSFPEPQPRLYSLEPSGVIKGTSAVINVRGAYLNTTTAVRVDGRGVTAQLVPLDKGKSYSSSVVSVKITVAADATPGLHELRMVTAGGATNIARFAVGTLPEFLEIEPNNEDTTATHLVSLPVVINGVISRAEDRDCFRFKAKKGQQMVFDLCGQRLHPYISSLRPGWIEGILSLREITNVAPVIDEQVKIQKTVTDKTAAAKQLTQAVKNATAALKTPTAAKTAAQKVATAKATVAKAAAKKAAAPKATDADKAASAKANAEKAAADKVLAAKAATLQQAVDKSTKSREALNLVNAELAAARKQLSEKTIAMNKVAGLASQIGRQIAYSDHSNGKSDPILTYTFTKDGEYVIEIRDDLYRGRADFSYRLTVGELPYVQQAYPAGVKRGSKVEVQLTGINLGAANKLAVSYPANAPANQQQLRSINTPKGHSNDFALTLGNDPEVLEVEPNDSREKGTPVKFPVTVNGIIHQPGDYDYYQFAATKGQRIIFSVLGQAIDSPLDSRLDLYDEKGKLLKYNDDVSISSDSVIDYTFPKEGNYSIRIGSTVGDGGAGHIYRLNAHAPRPDFSMTVDPDNPRVSAGGSIALRVIVKRTDGFKGEIVLTVNNAPAGAIVSPAVLQANQTSTVISITMPESAKPATVPISVTGTSKVGETTLTHLAQSTERARYINTWRYIPISDLVLCVVPKAPATFTWNKADVKVVAGKTVEVPFTIKREAGFTAAVRVYFEALPPGVSVPTVLIEANKNEGVVKFRTSTRTPAGIGNAVATGTLSANRKSYSQASPALRVQIDPVPPKKKEVKKKKK